MMSIATAIIDFTFINNHKLNPAPFNTRSQRKVYSTNSPKMKFSAILFTAGASAALVARDPVFEVTNFSAGCIAHSTQCLYNFNLVQPGTGQTTPQVCKALVPANTDGSLPNVVDAACEETSRTFSVTKVDGGLTLTVSQPVTPSSNQSGSHLIANSELEFQDSPNVHIQQYKGPTSFSLDS
ncbi:hypothetical protein F4680DRAFT_304907 [Xylaria scruposa]|nr:hypothetical protein F4680DRAFT_304907 [Xylaria scruposa]